MLCLLKYRAELLEAWLALSVLRATRPRLLSYDIFIDRNFNFLDEDPPVKIFI